MSPVTFAPTVNARPADNTIVPNVELIVPFEVVIKSPVAVVAVTDIFIPAVNDPFKVIPRTDAIVIVPRLELIALLIVISPVTRVFVVIDTLPNPPALTAPLTVIVPPEANKIIFPVVFVVIPSVVMFPLPAVKLKFTPVNTILAKSIANTP
jgi:hypothetical protein